MVKRKKIDPEPEELDEELDEDYEEPHVPEEGGLTYKKRYTVGMIKPDKSEKGTKCYGLFFETEKLVEAKKEAEKAFKEDNLEVVVWDRDKWSSEAGTDVARYIPEVKDDEDEHEPIIKQLRSDDPPVKKTGTRTVKDDEDVVESRNSGRPKRTTPKKSVSKSRSDGGVARKKKIPPSKRKKFKRKR